MESISNEASNDFSDHKVPDEDDDGSLSTLVTGHERYGYVKQCFEYLMNNKASTPIRIIPKINRDKYINTHVGGIAKDLLEKKFRIWATFSIVAQYSKTKSDIISFKADLGDGLKEHTLMGSLKRSVTPKPIFKVALEDGADGYYKVVESRSILEIKFENGIFSVTNARPDKLLSDVRVASSDPYDKEGIEDYVKECLEYLINNGETTPITFLQPLDDDLCIVAQQGGKMVDGSRPKTFRASLTIYDSYLYSQGSEYLISFEADLGTGKKIHRLKGSIRKRIQTSKYDLEIRERNGVYLLDRYKFRNVVETQGDRLVITDKRQKLIKKGPRSIDDKSNTKRKRHHRPEEDDDCELLMRAMVPETKWASKKQTVKKSRTVLEKEEHERRLEHFSKLNSNYTGSKSEIYQYVNSCVEYLTRHTSTEVHILHEFDKTKYTVKRFTESGKAKDASFKIIISLSVTRGTQPLDRLNPVISFKGDLGDGMKEHKLFGFLSNRLNNTTALYLTLIESEKHYRVSEGAKARDLKIKDNGNTTLLKSKTSPNSDIIDDDYLNQCFEYLINNPETTINLIQEVDEEKYLGYAPRQGRPDPGQSRRVRLRLRTSKDHVKSDDILSFKADLGDGIRTHILKGRFVTKLMGNFYQLALIPEDDAYVLGEYKSPRPITKVKGRLTVSPKKSGKDVKSNDIDALSSVFERRKKREKPSDNDEIEEDLESKKIRKIKRKGLPRDE
jgi:hypothetical protein